MATANYTGNIGDLTRKALRNGGYEEDSKELLGATIHKVGSQSHHIQVLAQFNEGNAIIYLELDAHGSWIAEY